MMPQPSSNEASNIPASDEANVIDALGHDAKVIDVNSAQTFSAMMAEYDRMLTHMTQSQEALRDTVEHLRSEIETKNRLLERKERLAALGEMAAGVAHEIRNPLGGISLYLEMLHGDVRDNTGAVALCEKIQSAVERLNHTVEAILGFTRPLDPQLQTVDTNRFLDEVIGLAAREIEARSLRVSMRIEAEARHFSGDSQLLHQLLLNLMRNACQASPAQGKVTIDARRHNGSFELSVRDEGPGIATEHLPRIFTPFFTTKKGGTGLGLAYCQRIAEVHGGALAATNGEEGGACFTLKLPASSAQPTTPPLPSSSAEI